MFGGGRPGCGADIGPATVFGRQVGRDIAAHAAERSAKGKPQARGNRARAPVVSRATGGAPAPAAPHGDRSYVFVLLMYGAFLAVPVWAVAVLVKLASVVLPGRRPDWGRNLLLWSAAMAAAATVIVYVIGLGAVQLAASEAESGAGSAPAEPCRVLAPDVLDRLATYRPSYLPLGFDCVLDDGTVAAGGGGYGWFNGIAAACAAAGAGLAVGVGFLDERRARARA
ncbi:hypothetical protein [Streptomyces sp. VRA16 Mangrove soil]|uniref:hypothetical protein n=1 Tax=Streptomyces sp. VRA16 Mangrove soil TaxID=2817434 RepID=UPI001A9DD16F|nr:hypothetical protein [Streptomyces sp. VRA16 Mangrove soil]MBO1330075.1 hypothetical protein [Streptomyces sp. VRA16 Mangrove soil]